MEWRRIGEVTHYAYPAETERNCDRLYGQDCWRVRLGDGGGAGKGFVLEATHDPLPAADLYFVTGNAGKVASSRSRLPPDISLVQEDRLDISEPGYDVREIAVRKAAIAVNVLGRPVLCDDSGFVIPAADGWPGSRVARVLRSEGLAPFQRVAREHDGAVPAYWVQIAAYMDPGMDAPKLFSSTVRGTLVDEPRGERRPYHKSELSLLFCLQGNRHTLAEMTREEYERRAVTDRWERIGAFVRTRMDRTRLRQ